MEREDPDVGEFVGGALADGRIALVEAPRWAGHEALRVSIRTAREVGGKIVFSAPNPGRAAGLIPPDVRAVMLDQRRVGCPRGLNREECRVLRGNTLDYEDYLQVTNNLEDESAELASQYKEDPDLLTLALRDRAQAEYEVAAAHAESLASRVCEYYHNSLTRDTEWFTRWLFEDVRTPQEIREIAADQDTCGFELMKENMSEAEVAICSHHHLVDVDTLHALLNWMDMGLSEMVLFVDEAHQLEDNARRPTYLYEYNVRQASVEAGEHGASNQTKKFLESLAESIRETYLSKFEFGEKERLGPRWHRVPFELDEVFSQTPDNEVIREAYEMGSKIFQERHKQYGAGELDVLRKPHLLIVASFLVDLPENTSTHYWTLRVRRTKRGVEGRLEARPTVPPTSTLLSTINSAVLYSPVLRPFAGTKRALGIHRDTQELLVQDDEKSLTAAVHVPPFFSRDRDKQSLIEHVQQALQTCIQETSGRIMALFPSIGEAERYHELIPDASFYDPKDESSLESDAVFAYFWGPFLDQVEKGEYDTVAIVGVPYPRLDGHLKSIQDAYDSKFGAGAGWRLGVVTPTIRRVRKAMGLAPARVLLDTRYTAESVGTMNQYSVHEYFPPDTRKTIVDVEPGKLRYSLCNHFKHQ